MTATASTARTATLDELRKSVVPIFVNPVPSIKTLRKWFAAAKIPSFNANPAAARGGGPKYYSVSAVEKFFRQRIGS